MQTDNSVGPTVYVTCPMKPDRVEFLARRVQEAIKDDPRWTVLSERLLAIGGVGIAAGRESDMDYLLADTARMWDGADALFVQGAPSACHSNATSYYRQQRHPIATGWALSDDGCWRQHSWNIHRTAGSVIESTSLRVAYYGFLLTNRMIDEWLEEYW